MKKLELLIIILVMNCSLFSQSIKPLVTTIKDDTFLCFNIEQSKIIAKELSHLSYLDSVKYLQDEMLQKSSESFCVLDSIHRLVVEKNSLLESKLENQNSQIVLMNKELTVNKKELSYIKSQSRFLKLGLIVLSGLIIIK